MRPTDRPGRARPGRALQLEVVGASRSWPDRKLAHGEVLVVADLHLLRCTPQDVGRFDGGLVVVRRDLRALGNARRGGAVPVDVQLGGAARPRQRAVAPAARERAGRGDDGRVLDGRAACRARSNSKRAIKAGRADPSQEAPRRPSSPTSREETLIDGVGDLEDVPVGVLEPRASSTAFVPGDALNGLHSRQPYSSNTIPRSRSSLTATSMSSTSNLMHVLFAVPANSDR